MNEFDLPAEHPPVPDTPPVAGITPVESHTETTLPIDPPAATPPAVDPVRAAAGRLGGQRVHRLAELGREFEREHGLKPGRQRLRQLIQLGKRYELEHGLRVARPRRRKGDAWEEFLTALARVIKPAHRLAVERMVAALKPKIVDPPADKAA
jgi:hypothetical protein